MTDDLDERLAARFARQDDPALHPAGSFAAVRARAAQAAQRRTRRRRLLALGVAVLVALAAVPAIAVSRSLVELVFGKPVDSGLNEYIGLLLRSRPGASFSTPPRYVAGVRTARGLVLLWAARREDGTRCTGLEAAFGDPDIVRMKLEDRTVADNGMTCGGGISRIDSSDAGLTTGQGLGSAHVFYGQVPARVHAVRVTFEDGRTRTLIPEHGWVIVAFERATERVGHRPLLEQALDARGNPLATVRLDPWEYGGKEPPPPPLDGPGSTLLLTVATTAATVQLRLSAPGRGWERQQCWGIVRDHRSTPVECGYPAGVDPRLPPPTTNNNLFLYGPSFGGIGFGFDIAIATRIDGAWLVAADGSVTPGSVARLSFLGQRANARRRRHAQRPSRAHRHRHDPRPPHRRRPARGRPPQPAGQRRDGALLPRGPVRRSPSDDAGLPSAHRRRTPGCDRRLAVGRIRRGSPGPAAPSCAGFPEPSAPGTSPPHDRSPPHR